MDIIQLVVSIVVGGVFVLMLMASILFYFHTRSIEEEKSGNIAEMYNDPNLAKMEYDLANYDEETKRILAGGGMDDGQLSIEDILDGSDEIEGLEEITGNYKPD